MCMYVNLTSIEVQWDKRKCVGERLLCVCACVCVCALVWFVGEEEVGLHIHVVVINSCLTGL